MPSCNKTCNGNGEHQSSKYKLWFTAANNTFQKTDLLASKELITRFPVLYCWLRGTTSQPIGEEIFFSGYHGIADWSTGLWDLLFKHLQLSISKLERQGWDCLDLSGGVVDIYGQGMLIIELPGRRKWSRTQRRFVDGVKEEMQRVSVI